MQSHAVPSSGYIFLIVPSVSFIVAYQLNSLAFDLYSTLTILDFSSTSMHPDEMIPCVTQESMVRSVEMLS